MSPPIAAPKRPNIATPAGACDAHFDIFGASDRFPYPPQRPDYEDVAPISKRTCFAALR